MEELWVRLATRYLEDCARIELGIWIGNAGTTTFLSRLNKTMQDILEQQWIGFGAASLRPNFVVTIDSPDDANSDDAQAGADELEEAGFEVLIDLDPVEMELRWGVQTVDGLFEQVKEEIKAQERRDELDDEMGDEMDAEE
jgi:hypothetical protein